MEVTATKWTGGTERMINIKRDADIPDGVPYLVVFPPDMWEEIKRICRQHNRMADPIETHALAMLGILKAVARTYYMRPQDVIRILVNCGLQDMKEGKMDVEITDADTDGPDGTVTPEGIRIHKAGVARLITFSPDTWAEIKDFCERFNIEAASRGLSGGKLLPEGLIRYFVARGLQDMKEMEAEEEDE